MSLPTFIALMIAFFLVLGLLAWRDARYRNAKLKDVASARQKEYLNLKTDGKFDIRLTDRPKNEASRNLLNEFNSKE